MGHSESVKLKKVQEWVTLKVKSSLEEAAGARQGWCDGYPPPIVAFYQPESLRGKALYPCACLHSVAPSGGERFLVAEITPYRASPCNGVCRLFKAIREILSIRSMGCFELRKPRVLKYFDSSHCAPAV